MCTYIAWYSAAISDASGALSVIVCGAKCCMLLRYNYPADIALGESLCLDQGALTRAQRHFIERCAHGHSLYAQPLHHQIAMSEPSITVGDVSYFVYRMIDFFSQYINGGVRPSSRMERRQRGCACYLRGISGGRTDSEPRGRC